jgi:hypothetical protein
MVEQLVARRQRPLVAVIGDDHTTPAVWKPVAFVDFHDAPHFLKLKARSNDEPALLPKLCGKPTNYRSAGDNVLR